MKWNKWIAQKPSGEFRDRVLQSAASELAKLESRSNAWAPGRRWVFAGMAAALAAVFIRFRLSNQSRDGGAMVAELDHDMFENAEMLNRLDMLQDLDILEHWDGEGA